MNIKSIITEHWLIDAGVAFGVIPKTIWGRVQSVDENNLMSIVNRCLIVETSNRIVLIETGFGNKRDDKYYKYKYIKENTPLKVALKNAGYCADTITDVIFTHLHDDHCGGAVEINHSGQYEIVCKNANHWVSKSQWEAANRPNKREVAAYFLDNLNKIYEEGKMRFVEDEGEIIPNIYVLLRNGHTVGQMLPILNAPNQKWLYASDFIPSLMHISPLWCASVDIMPILAIEEKEAFLNCAVAENINLIFEHDADNIAAKIEKNEKGFTGYKTNF